MLPSLFDFSQRFAYGAKVPILVLGTLSIPLYENSTASTRPPVMCRGYVCLVLSVRALNLVPPNVGHDTPGRCHGRLVTPQAKTYPSMFSSVI